MKIMGELIESKVETKMNLTKEEVPFRSVWGMISDRCKVVK